MADNPKYDGERVPDQPTHLRLNWNASSPEFGQRFSEWCKLAHKAMAKAKDQPDRLYPDLPRLFVVGGVRAASLSDIQREQLLQLNRNFIFRSGSIRYRGNADL